jgi:hypothetical protein
LDSERWRREGRTWADAARRWLAVGVDEGWERAGAEPPDPRGDLAAAVLVTLRKAAKAREPVRSDLPPAYLPLLPLLEERGTHASAAFHLDDGRVVAAVHRADPTHDDPDRQSAWLRDIARRAAAGFSAVEADGSSSILLDNARAAMLSLPSPWTIRPVAAVLGEGTVAYEDGVHTIGRSADRRVFALVRDEGVEIRRGWDGPGRLLEWPDPGWAARWYGHEPGPGWADEVVPYADGERVLIVGKYGVQRLDANGLTRVHPVERRPLQMPYAALSADEQWLAVGDQDEPHLVLDADGREAARIPPASAFAHRAAFSADGGWLALNSCHLYSGESFAVPMAGLRTISQASAHPLDRGARAYRIASRADEFVLGDANGWLRFARPGDRRARMLFIGGQVTGLDLSADGSEAVVSTTFGTVHRLRLDDGDDPYAVGDAPHREVRRWLFLAGEAEPLAW